MRKANRSKASRTRSQNDLHGVKCGGGRSLNNGPTRRYLRNAVPLRQRRPSPLPSASSPNEPDDQEQQYRADCRFNDFRGHGRTKIANADRKVTLSASPGPLQATPIMGRDPRPKHSVTVVSRYSPCEPDLRPPPASLTRRVRLAQKAIVESYQARRYEVTVGFEEWLSSPGLPLPNEPAGATRTVLDMMFRLRNIFVPQTLRNLYTRGLLNSCSGPPSSWDVELHHDPGRFRPTDARENGSRSRAGVRKYAPW